MSGVTSAVEIKICGITRVEDAQAAVDLGAAMLGLNFYPQSPRCITLEQAQEIARAVASVSDRSASVPVAKPGRVKLVGVFVNMNISEVLRIARAVPLDAVQLHGDESRRDCERGRRSSSVIRALKVDAAFSRNIRRRIRLLSRAAAGHSMRGPWRLGRKFSLGRACSGRACALHPRRSKSVLAGGLHARQCRRGYRRGAA